MRFLRAEAEYRMTECKRDEYITEESRITCIIINI
jgi:hypothetical protein